MAIKHLATCVNICHVKSRQQRLPDNNKAKRMLTWLLHMIGLWHIYFAVYCLSHEMSWSRILCAFTVFTIIPDAWSASIRLRHAASSSSFWAIGNHRPRFFLGSLSFRVVCVKFHHKANIKETFTFGWTMTHHLSYWYFKQNFWS